MTPENQNELVIHTLWEHSYSLTKGEPFSAEYWMKNYKSYKFSTRLGETERKLGIKLCDRKLADFTNRFGHKSQYMTYRPIYSPDYYLKLLEKLRSKEVINIPDFCKFA
jgi:hypothetical protein